MKNFSFILFLFVFFQTAKSQSIDPVQWPNMKGYWKFDQSQNITHAEVGNDLQLVGTHQFVAGPAAGDSAVKIGLGSYYRCFHQMAANGGGSNVNEFTILIDFKVSQLSRWYTLFQTQPANNNDGDAFINTSGQIGVGATGYSSQSIQPNQWYRLVISVNLGTLILSGNHYDYYLDGVNIKEGSLQASDDRFSIYPSSGANELLFFADEDGEDNEIIVSQIAIFDKDLSASEISSLGGYNQSPATADLKPYLQTPTSTSMIVCWHNTNTSETVVEYGTTSALGNSTSGSSEDISGRKWHTVQLTGLQPNTEYHYRCKNGSDISNVFKFRTAPDANTPNGHIRFIVIGDSRTDISKTTQQTLAIRDKLIELYGPDWHNYVQLVAHVGDIVTSGSSISQYESEYFNPFSPLSCSIPFMVSIGNHENEHSNYYKYMKYDAFCTYQYPNPFCERFYSFYLGNTHFFFLNTNSLLQLSTQTAWLEDRLRDSEADADIDFVYGFCHHPAHSELWPDGNVSYVENDILGLLGNYFKFNQLTYGHSHNYEQGVMRSTIATTQGDYRIMLSGGAGCSLDRWGMYPNQTNYDEVLKSLDHYGWVLIDIDMDNRSMQGWFYSFGHDDKTLNNVLLDYWHRNLDRPVPDKPVAYSPNANAIVTPTLVSSPFFGQDSLMSVEIQITDYPGVYIAPIHSKTRNFEDVYGDSGNPDYLPIDLNQGIDLYRYSVPTGILTVGSTYGWRVRFRDHNLRWSEWSDEKTFTVVNSLSNDADFVANITSGTCPLTVHFTDLSSPMASAWQWDFDGDGNIDSDLQNPVYTYTNSGLYTVTLHATINGSQIDEIKNLYINTQTTQVSEIKEIENLKAYPNPFTTEVTFEFNLKENAFSELTITDISGRKVKTIVSKELMAGAHLFKWNGKDTDGNSCAKGTYIYTFSVNNKSNSNTLFLK